MEPASTTWTKAARAGLAAVFAWSAVRAATQTVTPGEAWNYDRYIGPPWREALQQYEGNNHVLNTILVRISTARIHLTELSMRLPSILCGGLYLWVVYRLARRLFGDGPLFLATVALLVFNPLVIDAMSEARGYGMALAAFLWALDLILDSKFNLAGVLLGLSVAASLSFLAPAVAIIIVVAAHRRSGLAHMPQLAALTAFLLLVLPLNHAERSVATEGAANLRQTLNYLTESSFGVSNIILNVTIRIAAGLLLIVAAFVALRSRFSLIARILSGTLVTTILLLLVATGYAKVAFPDAGAIHAVPLITLTLAAFAAGSQRKPAKIAFLAFALLCVAAYAIQLRLPYRAGLPFTGSRALAKILRADAFPRGVRIAVSDDAEGILHYYRWRYRQGNWSPIDPLGKEGKFDYYVLTPRDAAIVDQRHLQVLYRDPGLILAK